MVGIVDRLEAKNLARLKRGAADRRKVMVVPTEEGRALVARAPSALQGTPADALHRLPYEEQTVIARSLEKVVDLMEIGESKADDSNAACGADLKSTGCPKRRVFDR